MSDVMKYATHALAVVCLIAATAVADDAGHDPTRASSLIEEVKLNVLAVAWNEASSHVSPAEVRAIFHTHWSVAGGPNAGPEEILRAQRALSPHVTERRTLSSPRGNLRWTPGLRWNSNAPPGWEAVGLPWRNHVERWNRERRIVSEWVDRHLDGEPQRQCRGTPRGWGGPEVDDERFERRQEARRERGARPFDVLDCGGSTANVFFGFASTSGST